LCYAERKKVDDAKRMKKEHYRQMEINHQRDMEIEEQKHSFARSQAEKFAEWITTTDFMHADDNEWFEDDTNEIFTTSDLYSQFLLYQKKQQEGKGE